MENKNCPEQVNKVLQKEIKIEPHLTKMETEDIDEQPSKVLQEVIKIEPNFMEVDDNGVGEQSNNTSQQEINVETQLTETKKRRRFGLRKCNICQQLFKTLVELQKHTFTHSAERPFACIPCKMRFMRRCHLQQHIKLKHKVQDKKCNKQGELKMKHPWNILQMQCKHCKKIMLKKNYKRHMLTHDRIQIYLCSICNYKSREQIKFLEHMQLLHRNIPPLKEIKEKMLFTCKICSQSFAYKISFDRHACVHKEISKYKCSLCEYKSTTKVSIKRHTKTNHGADISLDEILEDFTVDLDEIKARLNLDKIVEPGQILDENIGHSQNSVFIKEEENADVGDDNTQYNINNEDTRHLKTEVIEIDDDEEDDVTYGNGKSDDDHIYVNESAGQIKTDVEIGEQKVCAADYTSETAKATTNTNVIYKEDKHYKVILDCGVRSFQCTLCNRILKKRYLAERHVLRHTGEYPLSCSFCPFKTRRKDSMHQHLKAEHNLDVKPTQEEENGGLTTNQAEETHYKVVLDGEVRVYQCNFCDRTTKEKYLVERHILTHTGEFPLACSLCSIKTRQKKSMRLHLKKEHGLIVTFKQIGKDGTLTLNLDPKEENKCRITTKKGLKVYQCNACNKVFSRKDNLDKHYAVHTGMYWFYCTMCNYKTNEKRNMQKHMLRKHKIKVDAGEIHKHVSIKQFDDSSLTDMEESNTNISAEFQMQNRTDSIVQNGSLSKSPDNNDLSLPQGAERYTIIIENDMKSFKCIICGDVLAEKCLFNAHFLAHTEKLPYSCTVCGHKARSKKTIKNHMRRRHKMNIKAQDIPEEILDTETEDDDENEEEDFNSVPETQCKYIEIEEENEKFLKCLLCDKKLRTIKRMQLHFLIHQGKFLYACSMCKYKAVEKSNMKLHMKGRHKIDVSVKDILRNGVIKKEKKEDAENNIIPQHSEVIYVKEDKDADFEHNS